MFFSIQKFLLLISLTRTLINITLKKNNIDIGVKEHKSRNSTLKKKKTFKKLNAHFLEDFSILSSLTCALSFKKLSSF
jgi:hypothetical protein